MKSSCRWVPEYLDSMKPKLVRFAFKTCHCFVYPSFGTLKNTLISVSFLRTITINAASPSFSIFCACWPSFTRSLMLFFFTTFRCDPIRHAASRYSLTILLRPFFHLHTRHWAGLRKPDFCSTRSIENSPSATVRTAPYTSSLAFKADSEGLKYPRYRVLWLLSLRSLTTLFWTNETLLLFPHNVCLYTESRPYPTFSSYISFKVDAVLLLCCILLIILNL